MDTKFGIVVLLDALGTRSATAAESIVYLQSLEKLEQDVEMTLEVYLESEPKETLDFYKQLNISFFGDTVLLTYEIINKDNIVSYIRYISHVISYLYITALENKILFRGAISIGEFIQHNNVVLGPAVYDAASWHDKAEFIGTFATPSATNKIKHFYSAHKNQSDSPWFEDRDSLFLYDIPFKDRPSQHVFTVNWPSNLGYQLKINPENVDFFKEFYALIAQCQIPPGTEQKYTNTEDSFAMG